MVTTVRSLGLTGIAGYEVAAECFLSGGLPAFDIVGLPDAAVREARERVRAAVKNCGAKFPVSRITVNLAPAGTKKAGTVYDLPIFVGLLAAAGELPPPPKDAAFLGELSLTGALRAVTGVLPMALAARDAGIRTLFVPADNAAEATLAEGLTVYGVPDEVPLREDMFCKGCTNPYGWTKWMIEQILADVARADAALSVVCLRYFNPVGAHESGLIGERPNGVPNNLMPYITQTAAGIRKELSIFGDDYETPDGTGVRDYIHITDLARGHIAAIGYTEEHVGWEAINLGTGHGTSVLKLVQTFERVNGVPVPHRIAPRRAGDLASCYAGTEKARRLLGWQAEKGLEDICRDAWRWQKSCDAER